MAIGLRTPINDCILLVRHGETEWNLQRRNQGRFDSALTERGMTQAHATGRLIGSLPNAATARIVVSPLGRARRTAEIIRTHIEPVPELVIDKRLRELSIGSWDGLTYDEIAVCCPGVFDGDNGPEWCFRSPDGERYESFAARIGEWLSEAFDAPYVVAVTHGIVSRILRGLYAGLPRGVAMTLPVPQNKIFRLSKGAIEEIVVPPAAGLAAALDRND
ncbi:MAG: histidine phosphatase family protein [Alphaproteobacteria bacterium]|nr:histidine phosphatase family protein [Alphaproteobacteria bacterium]